MRNFVLGVIVTLGVLILGGLGLALLGFLPIAANANPPQFENHIAMSAVDASVDRHAPHDAKNPILPTDQNLIDAMKLYSMNCAPCHGGLDRKPSLQQHSFYPPVPQLILHPPDDEEWHNYYVIRNGIRYSGMPAWDTVLSSDDIWKLTTFLSHIEKLPQGAQDYWKSTTGVAAPTGDAGDHDKH
jgi:mono/diheme cytochrome c family protein